MKFKKGIILLMFLLLIPIVFSKTVSYSGVKITSPDVFYCQPIFKGEKCLVDVNIQVDNTNIIKINPRFQVDFSSDYEMVNFKLNNNQYPITDSKSTFISKDTLTLQESNIINFQFWADVNGEFNLTGLIFSNLDYLGKVVLDPFINISVNSSYPSYHLIDGINDQYSDNEYQSRTEISNELSDNNNATSYDTIDTSELSSGNIVGLIDVLEFDVRLGSSPTSIRVSVVGDGFIYAVFYEGYQSDGWLVTYKIFNNGSFDGNTDVEATIDSYEWDSSSGITPVVVNITDNIFAYAFEGAGQDGWIETIEILDNGTIIGEIDSFEYDTSFGITPDLIHLQNDIYVLAYRDTTSSGNLNVFEILSDGSITLTDVFTYNDTKAENPDLIKISDNIIAVGYENNVGGTNFGGLIETIYILDNGSINHSIDTEIVDTTEADEQSITYMGNDVYSVISKGVGGGGYINTFNIASDGQISSLDRSASLGDVDFPSSIKIGDNIIGFVYNDGSVFGQLMLYNIYDNGSIVDLPLDSLTYDGVESVIQELQYIDNDIYLISYQGDGNDGYLRTVEITYEAGVLEDKALSVFFDYKINTSLYYWLNIRADSSSQITVYTYINGSEINTTNSRTVSGSAGENYIRVDDMVYDDYNFPFRIYTDSSTNISEVYLVEELEYSPLTAFLVDYYALNSTGGRIDEFSTDTLEEIEKLVLNFTINISYFDETINYWYFNFSMNGTNACALGNKQNDICYQAYDNEWIQFIMGQETVTFKDEGVIGDYIDATVIGLGTEEVNIVLEIDEHYQNVFKWYNAGYNFSDVYWGDDSLEVLRVSRPLRINVTNIPLDADQYKVDVRLNYSGTPTEPVDIYACNGNETSVLDFLDNCALVVSKSASEFQDDGTKLRGIFTKDLIDGIGGTLARIYLRTDENQDPYFIKMYAITNDNHSEQLEHSHNAGLTWHTATVGYESELNINWYYYDGFGESAFTYNIYAESNTTVYNLVGNISWDIDAVKNYPPVVDLFSPEPNENLTQPYLIEFNIDDPNTDTLNSTLFLNGNILAGDLDYDSSYYWDSFVNESDYELTLVVCELGTSELYCVNDTHTITVLNYCSEDINLYGTPLEDCDDTTLEWNVSYSYIDDNYGTCCNVTSLGSDCSIDNGSFINYTQIDDCSFVDCLYDATPYLKFFDKRIPLLCEVNKNASYGFLTYVKADDQIIQTNPERILIDRYGEYNTFQSVNGLVNLYYRSSILRPDRNITVIIEGQNGIFYEEMNVIPTYKDPYQLQDRLFWTWNNAGLIIGAIFMILIIGVLIVILIRRFASEWKGW